MKYKKEIDLINHILSIAEFETPFLEEIRPRRIFGLGKASVAFRGFTNYTLYHTLIEKLYVSNSEIKNTYTLKTFENKVIALIRILLIDNRKCSYFDIENLFSELLSTEILDFEVFNELFGASLNLDKICFGDFTIYNLKLCKKDIIEKHSQLGSLDDFYFPDIKANLLIGINIKAREQNKASEIADFYLSSFEKVMSYVISDLSHKRAISILNYLPPRSRSALVCSERLLVPKMKH